MPRLLLQLAALVLLLLVLGHEGASSGVSPLAKVLQMLNEMKEQGVKQMEAEKKIYDDYKDVVTSTGRNLEFDIKTAKEEIEQLSALIADADNKVEVLSAQIASLEKDIAKKERAKKETLAERKSERAEYLKESTDLSESIDALERAIRTLEDKSMDAPQAESLLQEMATRKPDLNLALAGLLRLEEHQHAAVHEHKVGAPPAVPAHKLQPEDIVTMLMKLKVEFKDQLEEVETSETNQAHNADLEILHLSNAIKAMSNSVSTKGTRKGEIASKSAAAKGELRKTREGLAQDEKTLTGMKATFATKTASFNENQKVRVGELEALKQAIEIIGGVTGEYKRYAKNNMVTLLQVQSAKSRVNARTRAAALLQRRAKALSSKTLSEFAVKMAVSPFIKVITMIEALISKMKMEAAEEAEHKAWCDEQVKANELKRGKKTTEVAQLEATIETQTSSVDTMAKQIQQLLGEIAQLTKDMKELTVQRVAEKEANLKTLSDAGAGKESVQKALVILKEFYSSQNAFLQQPAAPKIAAYRGNRQSLGVVALLEVIAGDFARLYAETEVTENQAAAGYQKFMAEATASKEKKEDEEHQLILAKDQTEWEMSQNAKDLALVRKDLHNAKEYYEDLKPMCLGLHAGGIAGAYEERARMRADEIKALQEAYEVLDQK